MIVERQKLENFRGFRSACIEFEPDLTILVGANGSGKSTILDSLEYAYQGPIHHGNRLNQSVALNETDFFVNTRKLHIETRFHSISLDQKIHSNIIHSREALKNNNIVESYNAFNAGMVEINSLQDHSLREECKQLFIMMGQNRAAPASPIISYDNTISAAFRKAKNNSFAEFESWFDARDADEARRMKSDQAYQDPILRAVRDSICTATGFDEISYWNRTPKGLYAKKGELEIPAGNLSSGERTLMVLIGDIARRLAIIEPNNPLNSRGVVLVDEIELHLHPAWQRECIAALCKTFPNVQFIVSTHSPQVVSGVSNQHIRILHTEKGENTVSNLDSPTLGRDSNFLLESVFLTDERPADIKNSLDQVEVLVDEGEIEKALGLIKTLGNKFGELPELSAWLLRIRRIKGK